MKPIIVAIALAFLVGCESEIEPASRRIERLRGKRDAIEAIMNNAEKITTWMASDYISICGEIRALEHGLKEFDPLPLTNSQLTIRRFNAE